ncbi:MAG: hypothetical protein RLZ10_2557 [Bacteroidota bacterium]|jgi:hypothetical protein
MIIKIRTKDDLVELLKKGISFSWKISKWRLDHIKEVHIHDFSGKNKIKGDFDREATQLLEDGRVAIAFINASIITDDFNWLGQNPIKYLGNNEEIALKSLEQNDIVSEQKNIKGLEISDTNFTELMSFEDAVSACEKLGDGWRLPTIRELVQISELSKPTMGEYNNQNYLTSTFSNSGELWFYLHSEAGDAYLDSDYIEGRVMAVRTTSIQDTTYLNRIAEILKSKIKEKDEKFSISEDESIEIYHPDLPLEYTWYEAIELSKLIDDGWRLPEDADTIEYLCEFIDMYGYYWTEETSGMLGEETDDRATSADVDGGFAGSALYNKNNTARLIFVRDITE